MYREIHDLCPKIHTEHISTLCGQKPGYLILNLVVLMANKLFPRSRDLHGKLLIPIDQEFPHILWNPELI
jgi:hypothetical protein